ncbi:hypothetical protein [Streptococcus pyogenes NS88.2]|nr:hypothetical protein [Streptococcus pyogenes NS88.2]
MSLSDKASSLLSFSSCNALMRSFCSFLSRLSFPAKDTLEINSTALKLPFIACSTTFSAIADWKVGSKPRFSSFFCAFSLGIIEFKACSIIILNSFLRLLALPEAIPPFLVISLSSLLLRLFPGIKFSSLANRLTSLLLKIKKKQSASSNRFICLRWLPFYIYFMIILRCFVSKQPIYFYCYRFIFS